MRVPLSLTLAAALLAACAKSPTATPSLPDPTVLVTDQAPDSGVYLTWWDQSGKVSTTRVAPSASQCVQFSATTAADSVRFLVFIGDSTPGHGFYAQWSPWFYPGSNGAWTGGGAFWTALATPNGPNYVIDLRPVAAAPC